MSPGATLEILHAIDLPEGFTPTWAIASDDRAQYQVVASAKTFDTSHIILTSALVLVLLAAIVAGVRWFAKIRQARATPRRAQAVYCPTCNHEFVPRAGKSAYFCPECGTTRELSALSRGTGWVRRSWRSLMALGLLPVLVLGALAGVGGVLIAVPPPWPAPQWMARMIIGSPLESAIAPRRWMASSRAFVIDATQGAIVGTHAISDDLANASYLGRRGHDLHFLGRSAEPVLLTRFGASEPVARFDPRSVVMDAQTLGIVLAPDTDQPSVWIIASVPAPTPAPTPAPSTTRPAQTLVMLEWQPETGEAKACFTLPVFVDAMGGADWGSWTGCMDAAGRPIFLHLAGDREFAQTGSRPLRVFDVAGRVLRTIETGDPEVKVAKLNDATIAEAGLLETRTPTAPPAPGVSAQPVRRGIALELPPPYDTDPSQSLADAAGVLRWPSFTIPANLLPPVTWTMMMSPNHQDIFAWSKDSSRCLILTISPNPGEADPAGAVAAPAAPASLPAPPAPAASGS